MQKIFNVCDASFFILVQNYLHSTFSFKFTSKWICLKQEKDLKELCSFNIIQENLLESFIPSCTVIVSSCHKIHLTMGISIGFINLLTMTCILTIIMYTEYHIMNHSKLGILKIFIPQLLYTEAWVISFLCNMVSCPCGKIYFICKELMFSFLPLS